MKLSDLKGMEIKIPEIDMMNLSESYREIERATQSINKASQEKLNREKKLIEETENTRQLVEDFKIIVQEFIEASIKQTEATEDNNKIIQRWTRAIGVMTILMVTFNIIAVFFK